MRAFLQRFRLYLLLDSSRPEPATSILKLRR
jgi:hypothetical protein